MRVPDPATDAGGASLHAHPAVHANRHVENSLLKTGALQDAIFHSANFSSIATDANGVIQIFNVGAERMLGYAAADMVNRITPADISDPQELIARAAALSLELDTPITPGFDALVFKASRGIEDIYELTYIRKDGSRFPAIVSVTALRDAPGAIIGYLLIGTDNTARKLAEEELLKAGALQNAIFNSANFSSIATDANGVIQIFNVGAERMLGYSATEVMNTITPADISDPQEVIARAAALSVELGTPITPGFEALVFKASRGIEDIYELTYIRKDGSRFPAIVSVTALRDAQEVIIGYLLIGTDNTARKRVEAEQALLDQQLRDQQFYTRSLIESNIDALMTTNPQGIITDVNQQMLALTGRTREALIGAPCRDFFTDPGRADVAIRRVLAEKRLSNYELTVLALDGKQCVVSYNAATFYDRDNNLQGVFAAARDVTERKLFERTLQEKNIELEHASRMKSEFLSTMSHELRTPLNAINGFSEALRDGLMGPMSETQQEYIGDIFTSGQHLLSLINDILDLSKVEAGKMLLELENADLPYLLSNSLSIVREKAAAQNITLVLDSGADLDVLLLDTRKTKQIVYNLLSNAVKFSARGGKVTLLGRRVARSAVGTFDEAWSIHGFELADNGFEEFVEISVTDGGIGISPANMTKLFQPFTQIDSSLARKFEGSGLGLALVKQMAELHGGTVAVASLEGVGTRFSVWLPVRTTALPLILDLQVPHPAPFITGPRDKRTAMVVEDDERAAALATLLLEAEGFEVVVAGSAERALELLADHTLALITLDLQLPCMSGLELLKRLRDDTRLAHVPVVIVSGHTDGRIGLGGGAAAVLQKPISRVQLHASLASLGLQEHAHRTHTVLVVDDDPKAVELIAAYLAPPAYSVLMAYGGSDAIVLARQHHPDLILLDLMMPDVDGFDVVEALARDVETSRIPILVLTAKQVTLLDRVALNRNPENVIHIVKKAGFDRVGFMSEVRRALGSQEATDGSHPRR